MTHCFEDINGNSSTDITAFYIADTYVIDYSQSILAAMVMFLTNMKEAEGEFTALIWFPTLGSKDLKEMIF